MLKFTKISFIILITVLLFSCSDNSSNPNNDDKIRIAAVIDFSGHYSQFGIETRQAMEIALKNTKNLIVEYHDSKGDSATASLILDSIIKKGNTTVVVTALSWISNLLAQKIHDNNMLQFAIESAVFDYANLNTCIRFTADISIESIYLLEQLQKYNRFAIMYFDNDYGNSWFNTINSALNNKIVASEKYTDVQTDFTSELQRIKSNNPEVIVLISTKEAAIIVKQARQLGITVQMLGTRPTLTNQLLVEPSAEGVLVTYPDLNDSLPIYTEFKNTYGYKMSSFGAEGYDLIVTLDQVYQNNNKDRNVLFNNYKNKSYTGALGAIKFSTEGQAEYNFTFMIVKNSSFEKWVK